MRELTFILIFFVALFLSLLSCKMKESPLLLARIAPDLEASYSTEFLLQLNNDSTFSYSTIPNDTTFDKKSIVNGKFSIKDDTIYFQVDTSGWQAFIKNNELHFDGGYFKMKVIENRTHLSSNDLGVKYGDFSQFTFDPKQPYWFGKGTNCDLTQLDLEQLRGVIQRKITEEKELFKEHLKQSEYSKQVICIIDENGDKIVRVNCISKKLKGNNRNTYELREVNDGGEYYFDMTYNFTKNTVESFYVHGNG